MRSILVLVHPGSACGSADFNLGESLAAASRQILVEDLDRWTGDVLVIDGSLSDEIKRYPDLDLAITGLIHRAVCSRRLAQRIWGCDDVPPHQKEAVATFVKKRRWSPAKVRFELTGAWTTHGDGEGCVDDVRDALRSLGYEATIRDSAVAQLADA